MNKIGIFYKLNNDTDVKKATYEALWLTFGS